MLNHAKKINLISTLFLLFVVPVGAFAQHRGDNLAFQGLSHPKDASVKATAMGGAYTALSGDINSLFYNPAGLADITHFQMTLSANVYKKLWRENQTYRPNRIWMTLPFYLEGLYIPNPANNGQWDRDIFERERDSTYVVNYPVLGKDPFGKEAADWEKTMDDLAFNHIAAAIPLNLGGKHLVISAGFNRKYDVLDFDRNDTYLDPHIGYDEYGIAERVTNDTLQMNWYRYLRERTGKINNLITAVGYKLNNHIKLGLSFSYFSGETNDQQNLDKVGWFDLVYNNRFRFSYDTLNTHIKGKSKLSAMSFNFGTVFTFDKFSLGLNMVAPYTLKRTWNYTIMRTDTLGTVTLPGSSGEDRMEIPTSYAIGISFTPLKQFQISFDFESNPFSKAKFTLSSEDTTHRDWVDKNTVRFGIEYKPFEWISFLAGYRNLPETFVPDGAAFKDRGPSADCYTFGISVNLLYGRLDLAYEIRRLKYYDSYFSNTNYVYEAFDNLLFGYMISF